MLKNYFIIAWRNLRKNKLFSFINIVGLSLAIPFSLMSLIQVQNAYELDNFHKDRDRIYRIITTEKPSNASITKLASSPFLLSDKLKDYPFIEKSTKIVRDYSWELTNRLKTLNINTIYVEPSFFEMFNFPLEKGVLPIAPNELVITKEKAELFFGEVDPIGKILTHPTYGSFKITGVLKPFKRGTQFRSDVMISLATYINSHKDLAELKGWADYGTYTFVKLKENVQVSSVITALSEISRKSNADIVYAKKSHEFKPQAFKDISPAYDKLLNNPYVESVSDFYFNFFFAIAIILLAGFNYTNLTLARSLNRAKEVGIRKVTGALRSQLVWQFVIEAIVIALFSLCLGAVFMKIIRNTLNINWISWEVDNNYILWAIYFVFAIFTGIVAGIFPAWILSGFQPVKVLKGIAGPASFGKLNLRKTLVVIQLVVSMCYIFFMGHLYSQFKYMATENENYNRKNIYNITLAEGNRKLLINEILKNKNVERVGLTSMPFGSNAAEYAVKANKNDENSLSYYFATDNYFIDNMQLKIVAGSNLPVSNSDSAENFIMVNEKAVKNLRLGSAQEAVGKMLILNNSAEVRIAGVIKDFCYANYQFEVQPVIMRYDPVQFHVLSVKTRTVDSENAFKAAMEDIWKRLYPHEAMVASWYDKDIYNKYFPIDDMKFMYLLAVIIFAITLMGLFGMVTYSTEKRIKEIGIRKVVGASVSQIVNLISWSYIKLLIIAGVIALPLSYISGKMFESLFIYHDKLNISLMIFFLVMIFMITIATICVQVVRSASVNPVKSLRTE
ncbi:MAG TPA: ABC transporter permease [Chitinophagaceae bacterium]|nr:ABC transporter permease [Chitinophagaceae bacterium]